MSLLKTFLLFVLLAGANAFTGDSSARSGQMGHALRGGAATSRGASALMQHTAAAALTSVRRSLFEPPKRREGREGDVSDHEAADLTGAVCAGACSCM